MTDKEFWKMREEKRSRAFLTIVTYYRIFDSLVQYLTRWGTLAKAYIYCGVDSNEV